ncbi:MAG: hypothetical protein ACYDHW_13960 [Syntrophorhabdaceae bacterium]
MFQRFGPFDFFSLNNSGNINLDTVFKDLLDQRKGNNGKGWTALQGYLDDLRIIAQWVYDNRKEIMTEFPRNKSGLFKKNKHLVVKQYGQNVQPSGQSLFSRGFEGTNYRLVIASDVDRNLKCRYGEYRNLSGLPFNYREGFPNKDYCDLCHGRPSYGICTICGQWYCCECSFICETCGKEVCIGCGTPNQPNVSSHEWYYHGKKVQ